MQKPNYRLITFFVEAFLLTINKKNKMLILCFTYDIITVERIVQNK